MRFRLGEAAGGELPLWISLENWQGSPLMSSAKFIQGVGVAWTCETLK